MDEQKPTAEEMRTLRKICLRLRTTFVEELDFEEAMFWRQAADRAKGLMQLNGLVVSNDSDAEK